MKNTTIQDIAELNLEMPQVDMVESLLESLIGEKLFNFDRYKKAATSKGSLFKFFDVLISMDNRCREYEKWSIEF